MYATRLSKLLLVALSIFSIALAMRVDAPVVDRNFRGVARRQLTVTGPGAAATSSVTSNPPPTTSNRPTTTPPTTPPTTSQPPPTSTTDTTTTSTTPTTEQTTSSPPPVSTSTFVVTTTAADGSPTSFTTQLVSTPTASLTSQNGGTSSGMGEPTRNIIIGVVVGVGGAIVLAVIALVAWRIWGRKKQPDENDGLVGYGGGYAPPAEKVEPTGSTSGRTPFQSTLESYHAPTQVNASSNF